MIFLNFAQSRSFNKRIDSYGGKTERFLDKN